MDGVLSGSSWNTISAMLDTDDVVRLRVTATCWHDGRLLGKLVEVLFQQLHSEPSVRHWYDDAEVYKVCTLRYPIMESFLTMGP